MTASSECADLPLRSAAVLNGTHRLLPAAGPRPRDDCDHCDRHEQHRFLRLTRRPVLPCRQPDPRPVPRPLLTSARSAPPHGAGRWRGDTTAQPAPRQTSPDKTTNSPCARRVYVTTLSMVTGFTFLSRLTQIAQPHTRFVFLGAGIRLGLPSHPASRRRSCLRLGVSATSSSGGLSPPNRPCRAYSRGAQRSRSDAAGALGAAARQRDDQAPGAGQAPVSREIGSVGRPRGFWVGWGDAPPGRAGSSEEGSGQGSQPYLGARTRALSSPVT